MIPTLSVKGHHCTVSAYAKQNRILHFISLVGVRESVRAALAAMQHGHSAVLSQGENTSVNLGYQSIKVIQGRLPNGAFHAIALGERVSQGDILILKEDDTLAERFYTALLNKSTLPLHTRWQERLLELAREENLLTKLSSYGVQAYALGDGLGSFETEVRRALVRRELPEIGEAPCV